MATAGLEDFWEGGSEPKTLSENKSCSVGRQCVYIFSRRKAKKLVAVNRTLHETGERAAEENMPTEGFFPRD